MNTEGINEQILKRRPTGGQMAVKVILIVLSVVLTLVALAMTLGVFSYFTGIVVVAGGTIFVTFIYSRSLRMEYEYAIFNGELVVDKITNQSARKHVVTADCAAFEMLLPVSAEYAGEFNSTCAKIYDVSSNTKEGRQYFAIFPSAAGRTKMIFEPSDNLLVSIQAAMPRSARGRQAPGESRAR